MKFLNIPQLAAITNCLTAREIGDVVLDGRAEAYSLKAANADKKFAKQLESTLAEEAEARRKRSESFSLPAPTSDSEAAGVDGSTGMPHRTLLHLIATLNAAYPDYDFSGLRPANFNRVKDLATVVSTVNGYLSELAVEESRQPTLPGELEVAASGASEDGGAASGSGAADQGRRGGGRQRSAAAAAASDGGAGDSAATASGAHASTTKTQSKATEPGEGDGAAGGKRKRVVGSQAVSRGGRAATPGPAGASSVASTGGASSSSSSSSFLASILPGGALSVGTGASFLDTYWNALDAAIGLSQWLQQQKQQQQPPQTGTGAGQSTSGAASGATAASSAFTPPSQQQPQQQQQLEVYSLLPDMESDPLSEGALWSFNYFFYSHALNRVLYTACVARSPAYAAPLSTRAGGAASPGPFGRRSAAGAAPSPTVGGVVRRANSGNSTSGPSDDVPAGGADEVSRFLSRQARAGYADDDDENEYYSDQASDDIDYDDDDDEEEDDDGLDVEEEEDQEEGDDEAAKVVASRSRSNRRRHRRTSSGGAAVGRRRPRPSLQSADVHSQAPSHGNDGNSDADQVSVATGGEDAQAAGSRFPLQSPMRPLDAAAAGVASTR